MAVTAPSFQAGSSMPLPSFRFAGFPRRLASRSALRALWLFGPVAACTLAAVVVALRALPLGGSARLVLATAVGLDVWLLALSSWSSILGAAAGLRAKGKA